MTCAAPHHLAQSLELVAELVGVPAQYLYDRVDLILVARIHPILYQTEHRISHGFGRLVRMQL